jgi:O-antigen/teichoic acid export membrane protein
MIKKVAELSVVALLAQSVSFVALPIIANIYGPSQFGSYSILVASASLLIPLATLKLETVLVVEKSDLRASLYLKLAILATVSVAILTLVIASLISVLHRFILDESFDQLWLFTPILIIVNSFVVLSQQILLRNKLYRKFSLTGLLQNSFVAASQVGFGILMPKSITLCIGWLIGRILGVYWSLGKMSELWRVHNKSGTRYFKLLQKTYSEFKYLNQGSLFESIAVAFPTIYVGALFGNKIAGIYALIHVLLMAPIVLVGSSTGSLILSEFSEIEKDSIGSIERHRSRVSNVLKLLIISALIYIVLNYLISFFVIDFLLGAQWKLGLGLFSLMILPYAIGLIWYPLVNLFWSKKDWGAYRQFSLVRLTLQIFLALLSYTIALDWKLTICLLSWGTAISQIFGMIMLNKKWKFFNS